MALALKGKPQASDSTFQKRNLSKTDIEVVFSHYNQDGSHSAVTGGTGTEELQVYAPGFNLGFRSAKSTFTLSAGGDVISSASTDRIDSIVSSASLHDLRTHANISYSRQVGQSGLVLGGGTGFSIESDYLSIPVQLFANYAEPGGMRTYSLALSAFFDDLRWGRLNPDYRRPVTLIYPAELRYQEWYDTHNRFSFNVKPGFSQVINKRLIMALYPEFIYQHGLLATPFHRVYFTDESLKVENLPKDRFRFPLSLAANYFAGSRTILKPAMGYYSDNFGIRAGYIELEGILKLSSKMALSAFLKAYSQSSSSYFNPYQVHDPLSVFYSSDYDLSQFQSLKTGLSIRWAPYRYISKRSLFDELNFRYAFFMRSDQLRAHMFTISFGFSRPGK